MTQIHLFLKILFKGQSENQNLGGSPDEVLHHLKFKNMNRLAWSSQH